MTTDELILATNLCWRPAASVPQAWAMLEADDFLSERPQLIFQSAVALWERRGGLVPDEGDDDYLDGIATGVAERLGCASDEANAVLNYALREVCWQHGILGEACARYHIEVIARAAAVRRVRSVLARWYMLLTRLEATSPEGVPLVLAVLLAGDSDKAGQAAALSSCQRLVESGWTLQGRPIEPAETWDAFAVIARELRQAMFRAARPERPAKLAAAAGAVGVW